MASSAGRAHIGIHDVLWVQISPGTSPAEFSLEKVALGFVLCCFVFLSVSVMSPLYFDKQFHLFWPTVSEYGYLTVLLCKFTCDVTLTCVYRLLRLKRRYRDIMNTLVVLTPRLIR